LLSAAETGNIRGFRNKAGRPDMRSAIFLAFVACLAGRAIAEAASPAGRGEANWPAWRGPQQNGVLAGGPALTDSLPADAWKPLWESEPIPSDTEGGFGSPAVAGGRVFLYCSWRQWRPMTERKLPAGEAAQQLGTPPPGLTEEALAAIEAARTSPERQALKPPEVGKWAKEWVAAQPAVTQQAAVARFAENRLVRGAAAFPVDGLRAVTQIVNRVFAGEAEFGAWLQEHVADQTLRSRVVELTPTKTSTMDDVVLCLNAADGRTLWKKTFPGLASTWGSSCTPCAADGRVYVVGSTGMAYAFDAASGDLVWTNALSRQASNASILFRFGKLFVQAGPLHALDPASGRVLWTQKAAANDNASPVAWERDGTAYILAGGRKTACVKADDGTVAWTCAGGESSTPAVSGDAMAVQYGGGLLVYRLTPTGAVAVADVKNIGSRGASASAAGGRAYTGNNGRAACVDLATGDIVWNVAGAGEDFASPILADNKLLALGSGGRFLLFDAADGKLLGAGKVDALRCTSPALAGTRAYVRTRKGVSGYELAKGNP
jgi:outer membrane protein assembly factor BamB